MPLNTTTSTPPTRVPARMAIWAVLGIALTGMLPRARAQAPSPSAEPAIAAAAVRWVCNTTVNCRAVGMLRNTLVVDPMRFSASSDDMAAAVPLAYGLSGPQIDGLPPWAGWDSYQITIAATSPVSRAQMQQVLLRKVLDQCFAIRATTVTKPVPGYALVVAPGGIKFKAAKTPPPRQVVEGVMTLSTVPQLVALLNRLYYGGRFGVTRPISDATGLGGFYSIPFPAPGALEPGENVLAALGRLGLQVKPAPGTDTRLRIQHMDYLRKSCIIGPEPARPRD
ncbi:MAG TPA: TIGR03435 family protein [Terriglobales bacterium]|nr:TIGR03435 family protein [Terriglobales bacterium]